MSEFVEVRVGARCEVSAGLPLDAIAELKRSFTHVNPDHLKKIRMGLSRWAAGPPKIATWFQGPAGFSVPRGGARKLREVLASLGYQVRFKDCRVRFQPIAFPPIAITPWDHQVRIVDACVEKQQGVVRAGTGSGKTSAALMLAARLGQPTLAVMRDANLMKQWRDRVRDELRLSLDEIGMLGSGSKKIGPRVTLALQQTLWSKSFPLDAIVDKFGLVLADEAHGLASRTFSGVMDKFPAMYRFGFSADEQRRDRMEFLIYDLLGDVIVEVPRQELEDKGTVERVTVRMVPTDFDAPWYRNCEDVDKFNRLLEEMIQCQPRDKLLDETMRYLKADDQLPAFIWSHRRNHAKWIADDLAFKAGITCGLMIGGADYRARFDEDKERLKRGELDMAAGTFSAIGQGIDVPAVRAGIMATPVMQNKQFFGQVRGRVSRGKGGMPVYLYAIWDRLVFPDAPRNAANWNDNRVEIFENGAWRPFYERR